jgi:hypothetical protein
MGEREIVEGKRNCGGESDCFDVGYGSGNDDYPWSGYGNGCGSDA